MLPGDLFRRSGALSNTQASRDSEIPRSLLLPHPSFVIKMGKRDKARSVAVSIPFCCDPPPKEGEIGPLNVFICLVSSRKHEGKFVLPKGGAEKGEVERESAIRELWEEAGLVPSPSQPNLPAAFFSASDPLADHKPHKSSPSEDSSSETFVPRAIYTAHPIYVQRGEKAQELADWPEKKERERQWFGLAEAKKRLEWRKDVSKLLEDWSKDLPNAS